MRWADGTITPWREVPPVLIPEIQRLRAKAHQRYAQQHQWDAFMAEAMRYQQQQEAAFRSNFWAQPQQPPPHEPPPDAEKYARDFIEWNRRRNK